MGIPCSIVHVTLIHLTFCQESGPRFPSQERATERIYISSKNGLRAERGGLFFLLQLLSQLLDLPLQNMLERQFILVVQTPKPL